MNIKELAYEKYRLRWMIDHGYTLIDLMEELNKMQEENPDATVSQLFDDWEFGYGFGSEIWADYLEFMQYEFLNHDYMHRLLTNSEFEVYVKYIVDQGEIYNV